MRCWEANGPAFDKLAENFDIFVVTENEWIDELHSNLYQIFCIENDPIEAARHEMLKTLLPSPHKSPEGLKMLQWSKLAYGMRQLAEKEILRGQRYQRIFKLRSDLANLSDINFERPMEVGVFYCQSDYCFAAERNTFFRLQHFFDCPEDYADWQTPVDTQLAGFAESDFAAARFRWLPYPTSFRFLPWAIAQRALRWGWKFPGQRGFSYRSANWRSIRFASEVAFLRAILEAGGRVMPIGRAPIRLADARKSSIADQ